jgi:DNA-binding NarL/FixJ family response regulator
MDLQMPVMSGREALAAIRREFPHARLIVLTTTAGDDEVVRAFEAGASAFLRKNRAHQDLLDTIRIVHRGEKAISPDLE